MHLGRVIICGLMSFAICGFSLPLKAQEGEETEPTIDSVDEVPQSSEDVPVEQKINTTSDYIKGDSAVSEPEAEITYPSDVEVEKNVFSSATKTCKCEFNYLKPYRERRSNWGFLWGVGYSSYNPDDYPPNFVVNTTFDDYYGIAESSLIELTLGLKWNMAVGSITFELGGGNYLNQGKDDSTLKLTPARAGLTLALDALFPEPVVVPYVSIGAYTMFYEEKLASQKISGNTAIGIYYTGGARVQLNGIDPDSSAESYDETGLENTFLFAEARSFMETSGRFNFDSPIQVGGGLIFEY